MGAVNQQESLSVPEELKWFLAGLIEAEGSVCVSIKKHPTARLGFLVAPEFFIYQHKNRRALLELAQRVFGAGSIDPKQGNPDVLVFKIAGRQRLSETVLPFLVKYMKYAAKSDDYAKFERIIRLFEAGTHRTAEGLAAIVRIAYTMNHDGKQRQRPIEVVLDRILRGHTPDATQGEDMVRTPRRRGEPGGKRNDLASE